MPCRPQTVRTRRASAKVAPTNGVEYDYGALVENGKLYVGLTISDVAIDSENHRVCTPSKSIQAKLIVWPRDATEDDKRRMTDNFIPGYDGNIYCSRYSAEYDNGVRLYQDEYVDGRKIEATSGASISFYRNPPPICSTKKGAPELVYCPGWDLTRIMLTRH